ncbi:sedoheptulose 7-phosphate cyclase [Parasphingopyxis algicola]|uniref:hypothetical protein n=1 Tax=Parasphingopyxis algicola TaxID=2026624 RepID=UPI0015A049B4|nr:hypothetical protein [Parasphingopyxis algicola]QLC24212.1 sedoheptulose 7-phosphate cyclase [Parasphingopyxis algicola]
MASKKSDLPEGTDTVIDVPADEAEKGTVTKAKERIKDEASNLKTQATQQAREYATQGKDKATGAIRDVSAAMDDAAKSVDERLGESYGEYARMAAGAVSTFAEKLEGKEVEDMLRDAENFVRRSPVVAIGIAAVAGFAIARLVKSGLGERDDA